jgi:hypothetical protein
VSGQLPFVADSFNDLLFKIVLEAAPPISTYAPFLDPRFAAIITKAMAREAVDRYQTAEELAEAIVGWLRESGEASRMPSLAPSYRQAHSQAAYSGSQTRPAQTPSPMATLAVGPPSPVANTDAFPYSQKLSRGTTPPTPNTFGRTSADALERPTLERPVWKNPALWVAAALGIAVLAFGAFLLAPGEEPAAATTGSGEPGEQAHGVAAEPPAPLAPPSTPAHAPSTPPPEPARAAEPTAEPAKPAEESASTTASKKDPSRKASKPAPAPAARPQSPAPSAPASTPPPAPTSGEPANKRFYFGY